MDARVKCASCQRELPSSAFSGAQKKKAMRRAGGRCSACVDGKLSAAPALRLGQLAELTGLTGELQDLDGSDATVVRQDGDQVHLKHQHKMRHGGDNPTVRLIDVKLENLVLIDHCARCCERARLSTMVCCSGCKERWYCSHDCKRVDWEQGAHGIECRRRQRRRADDISGRPGFREGEMGNDFLKVSSANAGELLSRRMTAFMLIADLRGQRQPIAWLTFKMRKDRPPTCKLDALDHREIRPRMQQLELAGGESGIVHTLQVIDRNRAYGDLTAVCLQLDGLAEGGVTYTLKTFKEFERWWARWRCDLTYFGSLGRIRQKSPAKRADIIDALVREGFGGYYLRDTEDWTRTLPTRLDKKSKSAALQLVTLEEKQRTVMRMETFGAVTDSDKWLKAIEGKADIQGREAFMANRAALATHDAEKRAIREELSCSTSDKSHAIARAAALRHEGNDALKAGGTEAAHALYTQAIDLLLFASKAESLTALALCLSNRAEVHLRLRQPDEALEDIEDASDFLTQDGLEASECATIVVKLESRHKRALDAKAAREAAEQQAREAQRAAAARERAAEKRHMARAEAVRSAMAAKKAQRRQASAEASARTDADRAAAERVSAEAAEARAAEALVAEARAAEARAAEARAVEAQESKEAQDAERSAAAVRRHEVIVRRRANRQAREDRKRQEQEAREAAAEAERQAALWRAASAELARIEQHRREARAEEEDYLAYEEELWRREKQRLQSSVASGTSSAGSNVADEDDECPMCMVNDERPLCKPCGFHSMHVCCAYRWRQQRRSGVLDKLGHPQEPNCPVCDRPI